MSVFNVPRNLEEREREKERENCPVIYCICLAMGCKAMGDEKIDRMINILKPFELCVSLSLVSKRAYPYVWQKIETHTRTHKRPIGFITALGRVIWQIYSHTHTHASPKGFYFLFFFLRNESPKLQKEFKTGIVMINCTVKLSHIRIFTTNVK